MKFLLKKYSEDLTIFTSSLLEFRNTPNLSGKSPAQMFFFWCRLHGKLPHLPGSNNLDIANAKAGADHCKEVDGATWTPPWNYSATLQIFIVKLLCKSIKIIRIIYNLMIKNFFCKFHRWNPGIAKQLSKTLENKSQCWSELLSVYNKFWHECEIELICNYF